MTALSPAKADRLYWLGRYAQRALVSRAEDLAYNIGQAYENGFVLRDLLDSEVFAYLRIAHTKAEALVPGDFLSTREVRDSLYAFWGIVEVSVPPEAEALCRWGRWLELWLAHAGPGGSREGSWNALHRVWSDLRVGEPPNRSVETVTAWFGVCYGEE